MSILNIVSTIKKMAVKELGDSIYENYHSQIGLTKENSYYLKKRQKKIAIVCNKINRKNI